MSGDQQAAGTLAIDVGSSRLKLGWFPSASGCQQKPPTSLPIAAPSLPEPTLSLTIDHQRDLSQSIGDRLQHWLHEEIATEPCILLASVQPAVDAGLQQLFAQLAWNGFRKLTHRDLPLEIDVDYPERVGIDRLLNAVGANRLRDPALPAIVVDLGTAGTVDLVSAEGVFQGGAILPGMTLSARALHTATASLPQLETSWSEQAVPIVGKNTEAAIASGVYWGAVGAIDGLVGRLSEQCAARPQLFLTGGGSAAVADQLRTPVTPGKHVPHLILSTISTLAGELS